MNYPSARKVLRLYIHTQTYTICTYAHLHIYVYRRMQVWVYMYLYVGIYMLIHIDINTHLHVWVHVRRCKYTHMCVYIPCTHVYIHKQGGDKAWDASQVAGLFVQKSQYL